MILVAIIYLKPFSFFLFNLARSELLTIPGPARLTIRITLGKIKMIF